MAEPISTDMPPLDDCGFIQVPSPDGPLWMTCEQCGKSDHFWIKDGQIRCRCGAVYSHAVRPDGSTAAIGELTAVPFEEGPMTLADTEWDPVKIGFTFVIFGGLFGTIVWWMFG